MNAASMLYFSLKRLPCIRFIVVKKIWKLPSPSPRKRFQTNVRPRYLFLEFYGIGKNVTSSYVTLYVVTYLFVRGQTRGQLTFCTLSRTEAFQLFFIFITYIFIVNRELWLTWICPAFFSQFTRLLHTILIRHVLKYKDNDRSVPSTDP